MHIASGTRYGTTRATPCESRIIIIIIAILLFEYIIPQNYNGQSHIVAAKRSLFPLFFPPRKALTIIRIMKKPTETASSNCITNKFDVNENENRIIFHLCGRARAKCTVPQLSAAHTGLAYDPKYEWANSVYNHFICCGRCCFCWQRITIKIERRCMREGGKNARLGDIVAFGFPRVYIYHFSRLHFTSICRPCASCSPF